MNTKFKIKREYLDSKIITKDKNGNEILIDNHSFNDYFAECMFSNNLGHLIEINPLYSEAINSEKKTFTQVTENVIALTSNPLLTESEQQKQMPKKRASRSDAGKPRQAKA